MIETRNAQEERLVWELEKMLEAISNRDWAKANGHRKHSGQVARMLGERGKEIQKLHGEAARAARETRIG